MAKQHRLGTQDNKDLVDTVKDYTKVIADNDERIMTD